VKKFLLIMHINRKESSLEDWTKYLADMKKGKHLIGGSALGKGIAMKKSKVMPQISKSIGGYMVIQARDIRVAKRLMKTNPMHVLGSSVELIPLIDI
jgi:hypothetical protein